MRNVDGSSPVQSVDRAVTILELLAQHQSLGASALADHLGVHKSTASRLVGALAARGLVEQEHDRGKYRLGPGILRLAGVTTARLDLVAESRALIRDLAARTGETINLAVLSGGSALYLDQVSGTSTRSSYDWVGQHIPLHATSNGKVLISELPSVQLDELLAELQAYTPSTVTSPDLLLAELEQVRTSGYAVAADELDIGLTAIAAPVRDARGDIVASVSVSGPTFRFGETHRESLVPEVMKTAAGISSRLGWIG